jgi:hypothetical protein
MQAGAVLAQRPQGPVDTAVDGKDRWNLWKVFRGRCLTPQTAVEGVEEAASKVFDTFPRHLPERSAAGGHLPLGRRR